MRLKPERLAGHVGKGPAPIYVLSGDEPLQMQEARDGLREAARALGYEERILLDVDARFDWNTFREHADALSLFAARRIIDLRMPSGAPGQDGAKVLRAYAERPNPENLLVVSTGRLDRRAMSTQWFKALDKAGATVPIAGIDRAALPRWVSGRAQRLGLALAPEAADLLAERSEGNLLACVQELEKLRMLRGASDAPLDAAEVLDAVTDSSRFGAFDLLDATLEGDATRASRIVRALREEGLELPMVLGSMAWGLRGVAAIAGGVAEGKALEDVLFGPWWPRKALVERALRRHEAGQWPRFVRLAAEVDRRAKGYRDGGLAWRPRDAWDALEGLALAVSGVNILSAPPYNVLQQARGGRAAGAVPSR